MLFIFTFIFSFLNSLFKVLILKFQVGINPQLKVNSFASCVFIFQGYLYSSASQLYGVELNGDFCQLQEMIIKKYQFTERIKVLFKIFILLSIVQQIQPSFFSTGVGKYLNLSFIAVVQKQIELIFYNVNNEDDMYIIQGETDHQPRLDA